MDIRKLQCFVAVAFAGNLTRAAETVFLSQSAMSGQIKQLEDSLGYPLFERRARGMGLTPEGEALLPYARAAIQAMEDFRVRGEGLKQAAASRLVVGLNSDPGFLRMAELARVMRAAKEGVQLSFIVSQSRYTSNSLRSGEMQAGFRFGMWNEEGVRDEFVTTVPLVIAVPTSLAVDLAPGDWEGLAALPWIYTFKGCPFHVALRERMSVFGVEPNPVEQTVDETIMRELVAESMGVAVLREDEGRRLAEAGLAKLWPETLEVPLCLSFLEDQGSLSPVRELREAVRQVWSREQRMVA